MTPEEKIELARAEGILRPEVVWDMCHQAPIPYWAACSWLMQESSGGNNVYGRDTRDVNGARVPQPFYAHGNVTRHNYAAYLVERDRLLTVSGYGYRRSQGVGPMQLTYWSLQDRADAAGGCWRPEVNMLVGFQIIRELRDSESNWRDTAHRYNPGSETYADQMVARFEHFKELFAG